LARVRSRQKKVKLGEWKSKQTLAARRIRYTRVAKATQQFGATFNAGVD
jgi:hypothetical protein